MRSCPEIHAIKSIARVQNNYWDLEINSSTSRQRIKIYDFLKVFYFFIVPQSTWTIKIIYTVKDFDVKKPRSKEPEWNALV